MIRFPGAAFLVALSLALPAAAQDTLEPHLSYCYPAGGQRGTTIQVLAGGQRLNGAKSVTITGEGVQGVVLRNLGRTVNLNAEERLEVVRRLNLMRERRKDPDAKPVDPPSDAKDLPDHPLLNNIDNLSPLEEDFLVSEFLMRDSRRQLNVQLGETVLLEVTIDPGAPPGDRELRVSGQLGLTNPMTFQIGGPPEILEVQSADDRITPVATADIPVVLNGQIRPGDVDRFRFRAREGQSLVLQAHARRLVPFIADAVPGWFQATLSVFDSQGRELAFCDDFRFDPDPVLFFKVPQTGEYAVEIHDAIYRGREDFVYRIHIDEQPYITDIFPLGGRIGEETVATVRGWNIADAQMPLDTRAEGGRFRQAAMRRGDWTSNSLTYAVDTLPECLEVEPNDSPEKAQPVTLPVTLNGRIGAPGDEDVFRFEGKAGDEVVAEVLARRLRSPVDSVIWLSDAAGHVVAWNDDFENKDGDLRTDIGPSTHHADSYLRAKLPQAGVYYLRLAEAQRQGGDGFSWRLRLSAPRPDFVLSVTPSAINVRGNIAMPIAVHAVRIDGFDGPITLLLKNAPAGFRLQGAVLPAGKNSVRMTLTAQMLDPGKPIPLQIEGRAKLGDEIVVRTAVPCEDAMQAFLWRHLVPGDELVVAIVGGGARVNPPEVAGPLPIQIPKGGTVDVLIRSAVRGKLPEIELEIDEGPPGISIVKMAPAKDGIVLTLQADAAAAAPPAGIEGNLIINIYTFWQGKNPDGKPMPKRRVGVGVLPAIPFKVVAKEP